MYTQIEGDMAILIQTVEVQGDTQENIRIDRHFATQTSEFYFDIESGEYSSETNPPLCPDNKLPFEPLTERELEVARLIMEGYLTKQVALTLHIAVGTVRNHVKNIYQKLEVHSRVQLINKLIQYNLIEQTEVA